MEAPEDPQDFGLRVVNAARHSGFTLLGGLRAQIGLPRNEAEDRVAARQIVALAREYSYSWRNPEMQKWADEVSRRG